MQRTFLQTSSRSCLHGNGSISSLCPSDLPSRTFTRSIGNLKRVKRKVKDQTTTLLDPSAREARLAEAGKAALAQKYKRNQYNRDYRERRRDQAEAKEEKAEDKRTYQVAQIYRKAYRQPAQDALKAAKEDYELGPLAPKRDVGERAGKLGTIEMGMHQLHELTKTQREDVKVRMGDNLFRVHDRVVVLSGRERGQIGTILRINEARMSAEIEGINKIAVHVPKYMAAHDEDTRSFRVMRRDVRLDEIKLVTPIVDPVTGKLEDVILDRMDLKKCLIYSPDLEPEAGRPSENYGNVAEIPAGTEDIPICDEQGEQIMEPQETIDKKTGEVENTMRPLVHRRKSEEAYELEQFKWKTFRYIPGTQTEIIDLQEKDEIQQLKESREAEYYDDDTLVAEVDPITYVPDIIEEPFPKSIYHEITLRDRKEITRFSDKVEDAIREKAEAKMRKQMELEDKIRTPLQELKIEARKVQQEALKARQAESGFSISPMEQMDEEVLEAIEDVEADEEGWKSLPTEPIKKKEPPVPDVMVQIGMAMAKNWAKNPAALTEKRRKLLEKVIAQEAAMVTSSRDETQL